MAISKAASRLLAEERRRRILEIIEQKGQITIPDLVRRFSVSAVTARGDLDALSTTGAVMRSHGGAVRHEPTRDYPLPLKASMHRSEKTRIGQAAAEVVQPNETVILDSGTTTAEIARHLKTMKLRVRVITNAINIAMELATAPEATVTMIGGILRPVSLSFVGPQAEGMMKELHADRLFLGVDGIEAETGPSTPDILEAQLNGCMVRAAREVNVVADCSKLGHRSVSRICPVESVHRLITDKRASAELVAALRSKGVDVMQV